MPWNVLLLTAMALAAVQHRTEAVLGESRKLIFPELRTVSNYARLDTALAQDLTSFTLCVQMRSDVPYSLINYYQMGIVSYAVPSNHNELLLFIEKGFNLYMYDYILMANPASPWDGEWHTVCTTWRSSDGAWQFYVDGALTASASGFLVGGRVRTGGMWILGQDQDNVGGGFAAHQAFSGEMSQVNLWDRVLSADEIGADCNHHGNVIDWDTTNIEIFGQVTTAEYRCRLPCTADIVLVLDVSSSISRDQFVLARDFMMSFVECAALRDQDIWIGVMQYTCEASTYIALGQYALGSVQLGPAIHYIMYQGGETRTGEAIRKMRSTSGWRDELEIPRAAVILTDGQTTDDYANEAEAARNAGVALYSVSVGFPALINNAALATITNDNGRVFAVNQPCDAADKIVADLCG
ncbi:uncharacterized protein LOC118405108 isoform X2 [Branchiostoma floridae]|uniref:Uncharacterized protein LOC118405108 isoform X2 n=1 Tax=Branchiostoma floridae TaxID=7739 RepID=A0A9J7HJ55_BRAFL|nr:uncharacterized protein LOC118405108 isoform X2 [Branchiostoma floridae]